MLSPDDYDNESDEIIDKFQWHVQVEEGMREAGFPPIDRQLLLRRFWQFLRFLQENGLTRRTIALSMDDVRPSTELRASDLTPEGRDFVEQHLRRWSGRVPMDLGERQEEIILRGWYMQYLKDNNRST